MRLPNIVKHAKAALKYVHVQGLAQKMPPHACMSIMDIKSSEIPAVSCEIRKD